MEIDFRSAFNAISDVVQNRPIPLREFDQIYMKVGDMIIQTEFIARKFNNLEVVFIGDGDSISLSIMHLKEQKVFKYGPKSIEVLDFDERIVNSVNKFARSNDIEDKISARLYNVADPLPEDIFSKKEAFYTNPPWGASNEGQSVIAFVERGVSALRCKGCGAIVIADDDELEWTKIVLKNTQKKLIDNGFVLSEMIPGLHNYHLDDAPNLRSCTIIANYIDSSKNKIRNEPISKERLKNFYGRNNPLKIRYVKDLWGLHYGKAPDGTYKLEAMEIENE